MKSVYSECLEIFKKDIKQLEKPQDTLPIATEVLVKITQDQFSGLNCIERNRNHVHTESDKVSLLRGENRDLKLMLQYARLVEQALLEKPPKQEQSNGDLMHSRDKARQRNRVVISKLQEEIIETGFSLSQLTHDRERLKYVLVGVFSVLLFEILGIVLYKQIS